ncbi:Protein EFR3 [Trametes pubescens]|uniref:Protein EFR3 n=1 Tax=Trametes pubescens TaxID=154538 RepID=A0A1M2VZR0_TRAPU|nr:Protein EFR3 [Trametes pubescens]
MHIPFTPNHVQLVSACYPPNAALLTAGPEYAPNSQELSRLTYYAANRPEKINKLGGELEKRVKLDARKAAAGNTRARASLLITLAIIKALATECRRDMALLSPSLLSSVNATLALLSADLEIAARAATVFTTWTTYTDGLIIGVDLRVTDDYMSCLRHFATLGHLEHNDHETRNRTRLIGLAALVGAVNSEALYKPSAQFQPQVSIIMRALLIPLLQVDVSVLSHETADIKEQPNSPILDEFRSRPTLERRAASIHVHIDGDQGPTSADVANTALRATSSLLGHTRGMQASLVVQAALDALDERGGWKQLEHCQWLAEKAAEWTQYQYRYGIPTRLVESLAAGQDAPEPSQRQSTLAAMITAVFTSPTPLVNLSTSDIIGSLISITIRRIAVSPEDSLLPALVECVSSLGTHVYYADQIQDLAEDIIRRLVMVEANGVPGVGRANRAQARTQALRCLLAGLLGLIHAADLHDAGKDAEDDAKTVGTSPTLPPLTERTSHDGQSQGHTRPSRRTKVGPEIWQDTLSLLCDGDYAARADYARALVVYIEHEIPKFADKADADGVRRPRPLAEGPTQKSNTFNTVLYGDATTRFLNALHACAYALATSPRLGLRSSPSPPSSERASPAHTNGDDASARSRAGDAPSEGAPSERRSMNLPSRSRRASLVLRMLKDAPVRMSVRVAADLSDIGNVLAVLTVAHEQLPVRSLLTGIPMLVALEAATKVGNDCAATAATVRAIKELVARTWIVVGKVWDCPAVTEIAEKVLSALPPSSPLPSPPDWQFGSLQPPQQPIPFPSDAQTSGPLPDIDSDAILEALSTAQNAQQATGLNQQELLRRLRADWSPDNAYKESIETKSHLSADGLSPLVKVAPALMHADNISMQSLARSGRGVGVTDLREALEGRSSMSNPNLAGRVPSISTLDHTSSVFPGANGDGFTKLTPQRSRPQQRARPRPGEVRDVLNKLGIGKQNGGGNLKSSFPAVQKAQQPR